MVENYDVIKYYSDYDMSIGYYLEKAEPVIDAFDPAKEYTDINEVIALFNIQRLMNSGVVLKKWDSQTVEVLKYTSRQFTAKIGRFFAGINNDNFISFYRSLNPLYIGDFWLLFSQYNVFDRVEGNTFIALLSQEDVALWPILNYRKIVSHYDLELAEFMRQSDQSAELLLDSFLSARKVQYCFPKALLPTEYEAIFETYIESEYPNPNYLNLIAISQSSVDCPISPKLRLRARQRYNEVVERMTQNNPGFEYGLGVAFSDEEPFVSCVPTRKGFMQYTYSASWIKENLDFPTLLNNFRYLFEQVDACWRSNLVSVDSRMGVLEKHLGLKGKKEYQIGFAFQQQDMKTLGQLRGYRAVLMENGIRIEDVFRWFFEEYLKDEFQADGFAFNPSSEGTSYLEKSRNLACEIDGVLKQYRAYIRDGYIDRALLEITSEHIIFSDLGSFSEKKYAYANDDVLREEMFLLFSDQAHIFYTEKTTDKYRSFAELVFSEKMVYNDFFPYQIKPIERLVERGSVQLNDQKQLCLNLPHVLMLKDLFDHDVICPNYYRRSLQAIEDMVQKGELRYGNTLFSEPEQAFLNFQLNQSQFSNGLDLRNKYAHSSYSQDIRHQEEDYDRLLRIMALVVIKINEEFCLKYPLTN